MPEAHPAYVAPTSAATREFWVTSHMSGANCGTHPLDMALNDIANMHFHLPHDFTALSALEVWFVPNTTHAGAAHTIIVDAATCSEAVNIHTETINPAIPLVANVFNCYDLLAALSAIPALLNACDLVRIRWQPTADVDVIIHYGVRVRYT